MTQLSVGASANWRSRMIAGLGPGIRGLPKSKQQQRMRLYDDGLSDAAIAAVQGVTKNAVAAWRTRRQLPPHHHLTSTINAADAARRTSLFATDMGDRQVALKVGRSRSAVRAWRILNGIAPKTARRRFDGEIGLLCSVSLDDRGQYGRSRYDAIPDRRWSNWLEEMGATVW
ncbi:hypothetical protein SAQ01S_18110 [Sphingomonas aquatilis NBRC 16722]|uniref:Helix-turn-helix domain-containing protein n=1 Tax=Sphingomonas aquatilis TaxID=93063 RepID=A0AAW3TV72_9SPHN|nr:hypothetical protein [Sphingomonas aquatilis]MBB3875285.1 hypothetical protein [Sphingomonas aquatilis]GEM72045.1 hypothetical protein SAQ01S_18110 [Sphingomonas aquatilis NBRC 16722]